MIVQYKLRLSLPDDSLIPSFWAYRLYAWLLDQIPDKEAGQFHNQEQHAITQYLDRDCIWTINLLEKKQRRALAIFWSVQTGLCCIQMYFRFWNGISEQWISQRTF